MPTINSYEQFDEVLRLARRVSEARTAIEDFERERQAAHPALVRDWEGERRNQFDTQWNSTSVNQTVVTGFQFPGWEEDLIDEWVAAVDQHNEDSYELALQEAGGALQDEESQRVTAILTGIETEAVGVLSQSPRDRVHHATVLVGRPTEFNNYQATQSFIHYIRNAENHWYPRLYEHPNRVALGRF